MDGLSGTLLPGALAAGSMHSTNPLPAVTSHCLLLQGGLDLETPRLKQRLWNVFRILVAACPLPQARRANILVRRKFEFLHDLLERSHCGDDGANRLRLSPIRISTTFCHCWLVSPSENAVVPGCLRRSACSERQPSFFSIQPLLFPTHLHRCREPQACHGEHCRKVLILRCFQRKIKGFRRFQPAWTQLCSGSLAGPDRWSRSRVAKSLFQAR